jgi:hypothetical protein
MRPVRTLLAAVLLLIAPLTAPLAVARQVHEGTYSQTWVSPLAGQCTDCEVRIRRVTPHIIELTASNGWSGFAYYEPQEDRYRGNFEWFVEQRKGRVNPYARVLFSLDLKFDGETLTMNASSKPLKFVATYRKVDDVRQAVERPREIYL